jgi:hypothetical protein
MLAILEDLILERGLEIVKALRQRAVGLTNGCLVLAD